MKRVISTALSVALLLGLGALAVLARPGGPATLAPAAVAAAPVEFQSATGPDAPAATNKYTNISLPLNAANQFSGLGYTYDAKGLANLIGKTAVSQVMRWNVGIQDFDKFNPNIGAGVGVNFALSLNNVYMVAANSQLTQTVVSFVGDVPDSGSVHYNLVGASQCKWNAITLPLDQSAITNASQLANAIGRTSVHQMMAWNTTIQDFDKYSPNIGAGVGVNFATKIGYPYWLCMKQNITWPLP